MQTKAYLRGTSLSVWYTHKTKYFALSTGLKVDPKKWDAKKGQLKHQHPEAATTNLILDRLKNKLMECARLLVLEDKDPTISAVKSLYLGKVLNRKLTKTNKAETFEVPQQAQVSHSFTNYLQEYLKDNTHIRKGTIKQRKSLANVLLEFSEKTGWIMGFETMDKKFYAALAQYVLFEKDNYNNYFGSLIKRLKSFLKWCVEQGVYVHPEHLKFKTLSESKEIVYLLPEEVDRLYEADLGETLRKYQDIMVFACETGFRWSDIEKSKEMRLEKGMLIMRTTKNRQNTQVPATKRVKEILDRYHWNLGMVTEQQCNKHIKECCSLIGLTQEITYHKEKLSEAYPFTEAKWKLISLHSGRRTFISNAFAKGMSEPEIMAMIGSTDVTTFRKYLKVETENLRDKMLAKQPAKKSKKLATV